MTGRRIRLCAAALAVLAGCGVPTGGEPSTIPASDVPYGLAEASPAPTPTAASEAKVDASRVHWLTPAGTLVPRVREVSGGSPRDRLASLLDQLSAQPTADERDEQLSTALPPDIGLRVTALEDGVATIDLESSSVEAPAGVSGRRAVAQIVLTATSVPGVDAVRLELAGEPIEAPLPSGELTDAPLTEQDYAAFTTAAAPPAPTQAPSAVPAPTEPPTVPDAPAS